VAKNKSSYLAYIGTTKIAFLKADGDGTDQAEVKALSARLARGFERGLVRHLAEASETLSDTVQDVMGSSDHEMLPCRLIVSSPYLKTYTFQSSIYFHGNPHPITLRDVRQAIAQTRSVATIPLDEVIVQAIPQEFLVNDLAGVQNPLGLESSRLGVTLRLLTLNFLDYSNLLKVAERCELDVLDVIPGILASANAVLSPEEKEGGVMAVAIGGGATHFACVKNSVLVATRSIPVGADAITEIIEKNLNIDHLDAQKVKEAFGSAYTKTEFQDELIPVPDSLEGQKSHIKRSEFEAQLSGGLETFFGRVTTEIQSLRKEFSPLNQIVFTGGGVKLDGFLEKMKELMGPTVRIGLTRHCSGPEALISNPAFTGVLGGVSFSSKIRDEGLLATEKQHWIGRSIDTLRSWVFEYF